MTTVSCLQRGEIYLVLAFFAALFFFRVFRRLPPDFFAILLFRARSASTALRSCSNSSTQMSSTCMQQRERTNERTNKRTYENVRRLGEWVGGGWTPNAQGEKKTPSVCANTNELSLLSHIPTNSVLFCPSVVRYICMWFFFSLLGVVVIRERVGVCGVQPTHARTHARTHAAKLNQLQRKWKGCCE